MFKASGTVAILGTWDHATGSCSSVCSIPFGMLQNPVMGLRWQLSFLGLWARVRAFLLRAASPQRPILGLHGVGIRLQGCSAVELFRLSW